MTDEKRTCRAALVTGCSSGIGRAIALALTQAVLPQLRLARGRIVNVSSVGGRLAMPFNGAYSASKLGFEALSDALRRELRPWRAAHDPAGPAAARPGARPHPGSLLRPIASRPARAGRLEAAGTWSPRPPAQPIQPAKAGFV